MSLFDRSTDAAVAPVRRTPVALAFAVALTLAAPLGAQAADATPALRVVRDPVTGEMRGPNAAEIAAFEKADAQLRLGAGKAAPTKRPVEIRYADGTVETKLDEDSRMYSVVRASEDGALTMDCLPAKQAQAFVKAAAPKKSSAAKAQTTVGHSHD